MDDRELFSLLLVTRKNLLYVPRVSAKFTNVERAVFLNGNKVNYYCCFVLLDKCLSTNHITVRWLTRFLNVFRVRLGSSVFQVRLGSGVFQVRLGSGVLFDLLDSSDLPGGLVWLPLCLATFQKVSNVLFSSRSRVNHVVDFRRWPKSCEMTEPNTITCG